MCAVGIARSELLGIEMSSWSTHQIENSCKSHSPISVPILDFLRPISISLTMSPNQSGVCILIYLRYALADPLLLFLADAPISEEVVLVIYDICL